MKYTYYIILVSTLFLMSCQQQSKSRPNQEETNSSTNQKELKLLSYNVLQGLQNNDTIKDMYVEWVKQVNPDIVAYQEMNDFTQKDLEKFALRYGHAYAIQSKVEGFPVALTSKYPIVNVQKVVDNMWHAYLYANINNMHFMVIHFSPFSYKKRQKEVCEILARANLIPKGEKVAIMGDFNALAEIDAPNYSEDMLLAKKEDEMKHAHKRNLNNGDFDYTVTNAMLDAGYIDLIKKFHPEFVYSIPSKKYRSKFVSRIDFVWANEELAKQVTSANVIYDEATEQMSDHYPLLVTFKLD